MIFTEEYLFEATFTNPANLDIHYNQHVLKDGEAFDPNDPKFPPMTKEEYAKRAQDLSEMKVGLSDDMTSHYIGFVLKNGRYVKFKKKCMDYPKGRFCEEVIYVDDDIKGHEVISYMVGRPGKIFREKKNYAAELPENLMDIKTAIDTMNSLTDNSDNADTPKNS